MKLKKQLSRHYQLLFFVCCCAIAISLPFCKSVKLLDLQLLDLQFQLQQSRNNTSMPLKNEVVLIGIDEQSYKLFPEPFALWHRHLGNLFKALSMARPTVFGLDISLPEKSYNSIIPGNDQALLTGMLKLKHISPFVLGITIEQNGQTRRVYPPYLSIAGQQGQAFVLWQLDPDRVVRHFKPNLGNEQTRLPTLVGTMAERLGYQVKPGIINYSLGGKIDYIPLQQVLNWYENNNTARLVSTFKGKAVLLGTVLPFEDRHYQPLNLAAWEDTNNNFVPGVLIQVQALRNLLNGGFTQPVGMVYLLLLNLLLPGLWLLGKKIHLVLTLSVLIPLSLFIMQAALLQANYYFPIMPAVLALLIFLYGRQAIEILAKVLERRRLRMAFGGYVSPDVLKEIISGNLHPGIYGERKQLCVLFSDIRNFTTISEKMEPEEVILFLNKYLGAMTQAIQDNDGTIDKFMGDGIMAFFGAPRALPNPARKAFRAATAKLEKLARLNQEFAADETLPQLNIGIGLHMGDAVVGNIGSAKRNEYTAIGDVVNTASRIEGLTKQMGYPIVVSHVVAKALADEVEFDALGEIPIKGRAAIAVYGWPVKNQHLEDR